MRVGFPGGPRLEWYDRNPFTKSLYYAATLAPHSSTIRASYTVPAGKKAFIEAFIVFVRRVTVAGVLDRCGAGFFYTLSGGSPAIFAYVEFTDNNVGHHEAMNQGNSGVLAVGDKIEAATFDDSTGGTVTYSVGTKITEFSG